MRLKYAEIVRILKIRFYCMSAYFNLRHLLFLHLGLKYEVKIWLKYAHIFTVPSSHTFAEIDELPGKALPSASIVRAVIACIYVPRTQQWSKLNFMFLRRGAAVPRAPNLNVARSKPRGEKRSSTVISTLRCGEGGVIVLRLV